MKTLLTRNHIKELILDFKPIHINTHIFPLKVSAIPSSASRQLYCQLCSQESLPFDSVTFCTTGQSSCNHRGKDSLHSLLLISSWSSHSLPNREGRMTIFYLCFHSFEDLNCLVTVYFSNYVIFMQFSLMCYHPQKLQNTLLLLFFFFFPEYFKVWQQNHADFFRIVVQRHGADGWLLHMSFQICSAFLCGFIIPAISSLNQNEHSLVGIYYCSY